jgi:hypothetical protein
MKQAAWMSHPDHLGHGEPSMCRFERATMKHTARSVVHPATFGAATLILFLATIGGCPLPNGDDGGDSGFANTTDKTNNNAKFVGANACKQCHTQIGQWHATHGHAHPLTRIQGEAPDFPAEATRAEIPDPPEGFAWSDVSYVVGGYTKSALFVDVDGFILTSGQTGVNTQWNIDHPAVGAAAGFAAYAPQRNTPLPFDYSCFKCHTTGAMPQDPDSPMFQENRPGMAGTWEEPGVQCEACHGPGSNHFSTSGATVLVDTSSIYVDPDGDNSCRQCHSRGSDVIRAQDGYVLPYQQAAELRASGGHANFKCTVCHDPHRSTTYDRASGLRNMCTSCHRDQNMAVHEGKTFVRGDYVEPLTCESCHMPFATRNLSAAPVAVVGTSGRMGDTRTHIFRIDTRNTNFTGMFSGDGTQVAIDDSGRAAVTVDFVCQRCHVDEGAAQNSDMRIRLDLAAQIAAGIHDR